MKEQPVGQNEPQKYLYKIGHRVDLKFIQMSLNLLVALYNKSYYGLTLSSFISLIPN